MTGALFLKGRSALFKYAILKAEMYAVSQRLPEGEGRDKAPTSKSLI